MDKNQILLIINLLFYLVTFFFYQKRSMYFTTGSFLLLFYISIAAIGIPLYNNSLSASFFLDLKLFPFIYLYCMLMLMTLPVLKLNENKILHIQRPSNTAINIISIIIIIAALVQFVTIITNFSSIVTKMINDISAGAEMYADMLSNYDEAGDHKIKNIFAIISNLFSNISILMLFYYLSLENRNKFILVGLILAVILLPLSSIAMGLRGGAVNNIMTTLISYVLFKSFLSEKVRKNIRKIAIVVVLFISIPVLLITFSRFSDNEEIPVGYSLEWYYGQAFLNFNNYGLDANGIRYGDRTASLAKQIIWKDTPRNFLERLDKYSYMLINESMFYTFVGDFTLDYGPILTVLIFLILSTFFVFKTKISNDTILFHQLILIYFVICVCVQGTMTLFPFSDVGGNLTLITFILIYFWFKFDYFFSKSKSK